MRWWWIAEPGREWHEDTALEQAREAAARDGAVLRSEIPVYGWAKKLPRDGKWYPCKDSDRAAVSAWIWYGDVPK